MPQFYIHPNWRSRFNHYMQHEGGTATMEWHELFVKSPEGRGGTWLIRLDICGMYLAMGTGWSKRQAREVVAEKAFRRLNGDSSVVFVY
ncbi:hypothetical protein CERSUDRAFT_101304 [Gelatoporia subvermispora B]|uniref:DRBM domain-containing protein n=1 Tax=Ceriporiopsis subvermispora (strain B) TaxID=914234 RepID=M2QVF6_CERS8|nr:hypothetical protein CERSUDRAFT_101304 [Gelatoporia subvermispora B]